MASKKGVKKPASEKISDALKISSDLLADIPRITINDNREIQIENYKALVGIDESYVELMMKKYQLKICGTDIEIVCITEDCIVLKGNFTEIKYLY